MYFSDAAEGTFTLPGRGETVLISANALAILVLGALPGAILALCTRALQAV